MSNLSVKSFILLFILSFLGITITAQIESDSLQTFKEYNSIEEALENPEKVYRLNLSNQDITIPNETWLKFKNLEYLSLKNDHLKEIPKAIGLLENLKILDLSGNDFNVLPKTFSRLQNLQELFLNDETNFSLDQNINILKPLANLRILHLENDALVTLPKNFRQLNQLELLYLNNNNLGEIPFEIYGLKKLKYLDIHNNKLNLPSQYLQDPIIGLKIKF